MVRTFEFELVKKAVVNDSGKLVEGEKVLLPVDGEPFPTLRCTGDGSSIRERVLFANHSLVTDAGGPTKVTVNVRSF